MEWEQTVLVVFVIISSLAIVWRVGKVREPITPGEAVVGLATNVFLIWLIVRL